MSALSHPTVKIVFTPPFGQGMAEETRRVPSSALLPNQPLFNQLVAYLTQTYSSKYGADAHYLISYDDGEDMCVITSEEEIKEAIHVQGGRSLKIMVTIEEKSNLNTPLLSATPLAYQLSGASTPAVQFNHSMSSSNSSISSAASDAQSHSLTSSSVALSEQSLSYSFQQSTAVNDADAATAAEPSVSSLLAPPSGVFPSRTDSQDSAVVLSDTESDDDGGYVRIEEDVDNLTEMSSQAGIKMIESTSNKSAPTSAAAAPTAPTIPTAIAVAVAVATPSAVVEPEITVDSISTEVDQLSLSELKDSQPEEVVIISPDASILLPERLDILQHSIGIQSDFVTSEAISTQTEENHTQVVDIQTQTIDAHDEAKTVAVAAAPAPTPATQYEVDKAYPVSSLNPATVFQDYDALLYHSDSSHPTYYRMQLINDIGITLWTRSGFTVEGGSTCSRVFGHNSIDAIDTFKDLFFTKTGIKWEQRNQFVAPVEGKYRVVSAVAPVLAPATITPVTSTLTTQPVVTSAPAMDEFVHERITCDSCHTSPIIGIRYKCTVCRDFDICGKCETENKHPSNHILMKIRSPLTSRQSHALEAELAAKNGQFSINSAAPFVSCIGPKQHRPKAEFIHDVTLADGSRVIAGEQINKVFRVKNVGKEAWPAGTRLVFTGGDLVPTDQSPQSQSANSVVVPYAGVNEVVNISIDIVVPEIDAEEERMRATFRLVTADGTKFGPRIWIDIIAVNPNFKPVTEKAVPADIEERKSASPAVAIPVAIPVRDILAQHQANLLQERQRQEAAVAGAQMQAELLKAKQRRAEEQLKAEQLKAEQLRAEAEQLKAEQLKAEQLKAEQLKAEQLKAEQLKAEQLKAEQLRAEAEQLKAEELKAEQLKAEQLKAEELKAAQLEAAARQSSLQEQKEEKTAVLAPVASFAASSASAAASLKDGVPESSFKYRNELASLRSMGFTDTELNKYLLNQNGGNVAKCVDWILNNSK